MNGVARRRDRRGLPTLLPVVGCTLGLLLVAGFWVTMGPGLHLPAWKLAVLTGAAVGGASCLGRPRWTGRFILLLLAGGTAAAVLGDGLQFRQRLEKELDAGPRDTIPSMSPIELRSAITSIAAMEKARGEAGLAPAEPNRNQLATTPSTDAPTPSLAPTVLLRLYGSHLVSHWLELVIGLVLGSFGAVEAASLVLAHRHRSRRTQTSAEGLAVTGDGASNAPE